MIISRTPVRMSFVGGGTDLPAFYRSHGGAVVSTTVDKYVYVTVNQKFDAAIRVSYSKTEEVASVAQIEHRSVRESLRYLGISGGVEITSIADIPSRGTGLGSSSAFTVGLLKALCGFSGKHSPPEYLASSAYSIEAGVTTSPIGKQDQYAAAFGGFNYIEFNEDESVAVQPINCSAETQKNLEESSLVFYTGITRAACVALEDQFGDLVDNRSKQDILLKMKVLANDFRNELIANRLDAAGEILQESWVLKKALGPSVTNPQIDFWYEKAIRAGAQGGKLLGAGSGGFLLFFVPPSGRESVIDALRELRRVRFSHVPTGSSIIFVN